MSGLELFYSRLNSQIRGSWEGAQARQVTSAGDSGGDFCIRLLVFCFKI